MSAFKNPPSLDRLVSALRVLPGVGPKSASRMAYHLLQRDKAGAERLARALDHALTELGQCACCNTFSETPPLPGIHQRTQRQSRLAHADGNLLAHGRGLHHHNAPVGV